MISKENGGQATARNVGIKEASGEYIGFADSDDYVDITMFEKMYGLAQKEDADLVECHYHSMLETDRFDNDKSFRYKEIATRGTILPKDNHKEFFLDPQVSPWNKLYRKCIITDNNISFPEGVIYEDTSFYVKTIPFIGKQSYLDEKLVYYSVRQSSTMTSNQGRRVGDIFKVLEDIIQFYIVRGLYNEYRDELEYFCVKIAFCSNLSRIGRVRDAGIKKELLDQTFEFVNKKFPDYKKNKYFKGKTGLYIKNVNRMNSGLCAFGLSKVMIG